MEDKYWARYPRRKKKYSSKGFVKSFQCFGRNIKKISKFFLNFFLHD